MDSRKIKPIDLFRDGRTEKDVKSILISEGDRQDDSDISNQFQEFWDLFELIRLCDKFELSELEKWYVLKGRFKLESK